MKPDKPLASFRAAQHTLPKGTIRINNETYFWVRVPTSEEMKKNRVVRSGDRNEGRRTVTEFVYMQTRTGQHKYALRLDVFDAILRHSGGPYLTIDFQKFIPFSDSKKLTKNDDDKLVSEGYLWYNVECPDAQKYSTYEAAVTYVNEDVFNVFRLLICDKDNPVIQLLKSLHSYTLLGQLQGNTLLEQWQGNGGDNLATIVKTAATMDETGLIKAVAEAEQIAVKLNTVEELSWVLLGGFASTLVLNGANFLRNVDLSRLTDGQHAVMISDWNNWRPHEVMMSDTLQQTLQEWWNAISEWLMDHVGESVAEFVGGGVVTAILRYGRYFIKREESTRRQQLLALSMYGYTIRTEFLALQELVNTNTKERSQKLQELKKGENEEWYVGVLNQFEKNEKNGLLQRVMIRNA